MRTVMLLFLALSFTSCAGTYVPSHGGGKRFFFEQDLIAKTTQKAIDALDFSALAGKKVGLQVMAMGDEGSASVSGGWFGSIFGGGVVGGQALAGAAIGSTPKEYGASAFANARDLEHLKGRVLQKLLSQDVHVVTSAENADGWVYVVVDVFGTMRWKRDFLIYHEEHLSGRVRMSAFYLGDDGTELEFRQLGEGSAMGDFYLGYFLRAIQVTGNPGVTLD